MSIDINNGNYKKVTEESILRRINKTETVNNLSESEALKILFITGRFFPTPNANTINTQNVIYELQKRGHKIICIAVNQDINESTIMYNSIPVYSVKSTTFGRLLQLKREGKIEFRDRILLKIITVMRKLNNIVNLFKFPDVDPSQSKEVYKLADKLYNQEHFDCIIGVFRPFSGISAAISIKKKYTDIICGAYYLDLIFGSTKPSFVPKKLYEKLCYKGEINTFSKLDFILMAKGGEETYKQKKYDYINSKIKYVDFPLFHSKTSEFDVKFDKTKINLVYAGTLNKNYRNPTFFLSILKEVSMNMNNIIFHIYGHGNCESIIKRFKDEEYLNIIQHGIVTHEEVISANRQADFLVNISNSTQNIVPSKIFELFSTGKPIINVVSNKTDITKVYFDKYPSVCTISEWVNIEPQVEYLKRFLIDEINRQYSVEGIKNRYIENTPEFTADIIEKLIELGKGKYDKY